VKEDVWSLGVTMSETIFGRLPFEGETVFEIAAASKRLKLNIPKTASPELIDLLNKTLAPNPKARISKEEVSVHDWFTKSAKEVVEVPKCHPKMKSSRDVNYVQATVSQLPFYCLLNNTFKTPIRAF
jgi:serine/threonine protein kinase